MTFYGLVGVLVIKLDVQRVPIAAGLEGVIVQYPDASFEEELSIDCYRVSYHHAVTIEPQRVQQVTPVVLFEFDRNFLDPVNIIETGCIGVLGVCGSGKDEA